ncbi:MAG: prepilin peptidase [Alphaproteobacteria bacterium]|nr:prepilin peptidase [Alphaproteobacteria bacterium]
MAFLLLFLICVFISLGVAVMASVSDVRGMIIPNRYTVYVIAAFALAYSVLHVGGHDHVFGNLLSHFLSAGLFLGVTFIMFLTGALGAGDSKLGTAYAFWFSLHDLPVYLFFMALFGGLLGVVSLGIRRWKPFDTAPEGSWVAQVQGGASKVPYGVAIGLGTLIAFFYAGYFDTALLGSFLTVKQG